MINNRLTIGLMTSHLDDNFAKAVCKGIISCAEDKNVNVIVLPGGSGNKIGIYKLC